MSFLIAFLACNEPTAGGATARVVPAPGPAPAALVAPANASEPTAVAAYWDGGSLSYAEVTAPMQGQLDQMLSEYLMSRYDTEYQAAEQKMDEAILNAEAKKRGLPALEELLKVEVTDKVAAPTEAEITDAYAALQRKLRGQTKEEARGVLISAVTQKKQGERYALYIEELRATYGATVQLTFPDVPRLKVSADDDPFIGPADAPVTIVQFAEFQCPYCGKAKESTDQVMANYEGKVKLVFRDFPLGFHDKAIPAAVAANCAAKQDKYWPMHDAFMADQTALSEADFQRVAKAAGVELAAWEECRKDPTMEDEIRRDEADGQAVGVTGTPAFFINGVFINGAQPYSKFKAIIDAELKRG